MQVLAADIGGTKTLLKLSRVHAGKLETVKEQRFASAEFQDFSDFCKPFLEKAGEVNAACFGVAGPIEQLSQTHQTARVTNLPWQLDSQNLSQQLAIEKVKLINDFQAIGYGIEGLDENDFHTLQEGQPVANAPRAIIGAGTGLGQTFLIWQQDHYTVQPSEGGHVDFAPTDHEQQQLLDFLREELEHVSYERAVSGMGLTNIYRFVVNQNPTAENTGLAQKIADGHDPAAMVAEFAQKNDRLARRALTLFVKLYGAQAGNFALTVLAKGGVYLAGGIAPKNLSEFQTGDFMQAFLGKGRMRPILEKMPVKIILNAEVGLIGASLVASRLVD